MNESDLLRLLLPAISSPNPYISIQDTLNSEGFSTANKQVLAQANAPLRYRFFNSGVRCSIFDGNWVFQFHTILGSGYTAFARNNSSLKLNDTSHVMVSEGSILKIWVTPDLLHHSMVDAYAYFVLSGNDNPTWHSLGEVMGN